MKISLIQLQKVMIEHNSVIKLEIKMTWILKKQKFIRIEKNKNNELKTSRNKDKVK